MVDLSNADNVDQTGTIWAAGGASICRDGVDGVDSLEDPKPHALSAPTIAQPHSPLSAKPR